MDVDIRLACNPGLIGSKLVEVNRSWRMTINSQEDLLVEITVFEDRRYDAMLRRDVTYLSAMFGDGRAYTHSSGVRQDAAEYLHGLAAGTDIYRNIEHGINRIVRLADRELVYGWQRMTVNSDGDLRQWIICPWRYCRGAEVAGLQWVDEEAAKLASIRAAALPTGLRQSVIPGSCWPTAAGSAPRSCTNFAAIPGLFNALGSLLLSSICNLRGEVRPPVKSRILDRQISDS